MEHSSHASASFSCPLNPSITYRCCLGSGCGWWNDEEQVGTNVPREELVCSWGLEGSDVMSRSMGCPESAWLWTTWLSQCGTMAGSLPTAYVPAKSNKLVWNKVSQLVHH